MTWAGKLFEKKANTKDMPSNESRTALDCGYFLARNDLVLAVLEKNKEIKELVDRYCKNNSDSYDTESYLCVAQARAWRELVKEAEKVKK